VLGYYERRYRGWHAAKPVRATIQTFLLVLLALILAWAGMVAYSSYMLFDHSRELRVMAREGPAGLSADQIASARSDLKVVNRELKRLDRATYAPGLSYLLERTPWFGPYYTTGRQLLELGVIVSDAGYRAAPMGQVALDAFERTGVRYSDDQNGPSWLHALHGYRDEFPSLIRDLERAERVWSAVDRSLLPGRYAHHYERADRMLVLAKDAAALADDYDAFYQALGGEGVKRYLVLFQNPAELRPSGGFPGTFGIFTFQYGQLVEYELHDSHDLTQDYMQHRSHEVDQPWPVETFFPQAGFILHDANWYAEFPKTARIMLDMYAEGTYPEVSGIIAIQPEVVSGILQVTGPMDVEVDGEIRHITPDNVYEEVERHRILLRQGVETGHESDHHKDILAQIGVAIMEELTQGDRQQMIDAMRLLRNDADRRDIQIFVDDPVVQAHVDEFGWSGRLVPDPEIPTLAVTYANLVLAKASLAVQPYYDVHIEPANGGYNVTLDMTLEHLGKHGNDEFYEGFQRWWIEITIPEGAEMVGASRMSLPDPEAPNGGAYVIDLFQETSDSIQVTFFIEDFETLMIRRQPGQVPPRLNITHPACGQLEGGYIMRDIFIEWRDGCPFVEHVDLEPRRILLTS
jgi:hypothetical protein